MSGKTRPIRVDQAVWKEIQKRAQPLVDTPNSVLRRVFGLKKDNGKKQ